MLDRARDHAITVSADGYETKYTKVDSTFSWWRIIVPMLPVSWVN